MSDKNQEAEVEEALDLPEETKEGEEDTTDWKAEARKLQEKAIKQRERTKELKSQLKALTPAEKKQEADQGKSNDLDYGQKAYLKSYGVSGSDELALVKEFMANTGKSLDEVVDNKYFTNSLNELRDMRATRDAVPTGNKRSGVSSKDSVEYWSEKYQSGTALNEIPEDMQMKVLNLRMDKEKSKTRFSSNPIVGA